MVLVSPQGPPQGGPRVSAPLGMPRHEIMNGFLEVKSVRRRQLAHSASRPPEGLSKAGELKLIKIILRERGYGSATCSHAVP